MNTQSFKMVKDDGQNIFRPEAAKRKWPIFLFFIFLSMLFLFSCSKSMTELPVQYDFELSLANQSSRANVSSYEELVPYDRTLFVPCGNGGEGEEVALTGSLKFVEQVIYNDRGFTFNYHVIAQDITGLGLSTGEKFVASGGNQETITGEYGEYGQYTHVFTEQLKIIGQNSAFTVMYKFKVTITPDGKIATRIEEENVDCRP